MASSFNAFGSRRKEYGNPSVPVWLGKVRAVPVGGSFETSAIIAGVLYAAGFPISIVDKKIKPLVAYEVVSFTGASGGDTITIKPAILGDVKIIPAVSDNLAIVGATFDANVKGAAVTAVAASATEGAYDITVAHEAIGSPQAGNYLAAATGTGSGKKLAVIPNAYLYNDVYLGDIDVNGEMAGASGAAIMFHGEGILIDRTPSAPFKAQMKAAVPGVLQVNG